MRRGLAVGLLLGLIVLAASPGPALAGSIVDGNGTAASCTDLESIAVFAGAVTACWWLMP